MATGPKEMCAEPVDRRTFETSSRGETRPAALIRQVLLIVSAEVNYTTQQPLHNNVEFGDIISGVGFFFFVHTF